MSASPMTREEFSALPLRTVADSAAWVGIPERSFRAALDGDLAHLAVRVGRRVYVRTSSLLVWASVPPNGIDEPGGPER
jgi:hypothetical protein